MDDRFDDGLAFVALGDVDDVFEPFGAFVGFAGDGLHGETGALQAANEAGLGGGGPEGDDAVFVEGTAGHAEAAAVVETGVLRLHKRRRAVVHVEQDGVVSIRCSVADEPENVLRKHGHAGVVEEVAVDSLKVFAVPLDDVGEQLSDVNDGVGAGEFEDAFQAETETEATDQDACGGAVFQRS